MCQKKSFHIPKMFGNKGLGLITGIINSRLWVCHRAEFFFSLSLLLLFITLMKLCSFLALIKPQSLAHDVILFTVYCMRILETFPENNKEDTVLTFYLLFVFFPPSLPFSLFLYFFISFIFFNPTTILPPLRTLSYIL